MVFTDSDHYRTNITVLPRISLRMAATLPALVAPAAPLVVVLAAMAQRPPMERCPARFPKRALPFGNNRPDKIATWVHGSALRWCV